jgi:Flp pilus assembly protein TadD
LRLGAAYESASLPGDALSQYQSAVRLAPKNPEAWLALGNCEYQKGAFAKAEVDYRHVLRISPQHAGAKNNLAMTYLAENKKLDEAERLALEALEDAGPLKPYVLDTLAKIRARRSGKSP